MDAIANAVALGLVVVSTDTEAVAVSTTAVSVGQAVLLGYAAVLLFIAIVAISFKDKPGRRHRLAMTSSVAAGSLGRATVVFSLLLFATAYAAFADQPDKLATLFLTWVVIFVWRPVERLIEVRRRLTVHAPADAMVIERVEEPAILVVRLPPGRTVTVGSQLTLESVSGIAQATVVDATLLLVRQTARLALKRPLPVAVGDAIAFTEAKGELQAVGHVSSGTTLQRLVIEQTAVGPGVVMEEGMLVETSTDGREPVLHQVVSAEVKSLGEPEARRDVIEVGARKLGRWDSARSTFEVVPWLPAPGTTVSAHSGGEWTFTADKIGHVPGTGYGLGLEVHMAVTHNTAILGILGIGKTTLASEVIRRMLAEGVKVVVLDPTDRYAVEFADICDRATQREIEISIDELVSGQLNDTAMRTTDRGHQEAGNRGEFEAAIRDLLKRFWDGDARLLVLNPSAFAVTRMDGGVYSGNANRLVAFTAVEVTQLIAQALLDLARDSSESEETSSQSIAADGEASTPTGTSSQSGETARICLVLEEAHSLVPESNSSAGFAEKDAVVRTARAIMQGRKYGYGCIVITQRTANVTKSILNQCNSIFAMRIYDATGMEFLQNYVGHDYAGLLSALPPREAVVFGRALNCESPVVLRLNDASDVRAHWAGVDSSVPKTSMSALGDGDDGDSAPVDDDAIPF
ncbi:MAG: ATP-binding protein [Solirubrobacterales bacterium]|nr:ATP-binding protein [Solirubrobacterales bacterium]